MRLIFVLLVLAIGSLRSRAQTSLADVQQSVLDLDDAYSSVTSVIPRPDTSAALEVTISLNIVTITKMDDVDGYLAISGYLVLTWTQHAFTSTTPDVSYLVRLSQIWKPSIMLVNDVDGGAEVGAESKYLRYKVSTQSCEWKPWVVMKAACTPDVTYYPFDKQSCAFKFALWGQTTSEVVLKLATEAWTQKFFSKDGEWSIEQTSANVYTDSDTSIAEFSIILKRDPTYYMVNLMAPVILLAALNSFAFILPIDSGERMGFSITCFLSYVVLLNLIMSYLPTTASPMSYLSYYTFVMMVLSAAMAACTIATLAVHHLKETDEIPRWLRWSAYRILCRCFKKNSGGNKIKAELIAVSSVWEEPGGGQVDKTSVSGDLKKEQEADKITWHDIGLSMDRLFFWGFLFGQIFYTGSYMIPLVLNWT